LHDKPALKGLNISPVVGTRVGSDGGYFEFRASGGQLGLAESGGIRGKDGKEESSTEAGTSRAPEHSAFS
jgi:hypothetical protein